MKHLTLQAKATATDLGEFTAIAAAYSVDRGNERIIPGAFATTIENWQASGKQIPLHWDHSGSPADIIGTVDPVSMKETDAGLMVVGKLDLEGSETAREAWRAMKSNSMALSFGYMVTDGGEAEDGVYELKSIDLFEISVTPSPMNADTRFLDLKSVGEMDATDMRIIEILKSSGGDALAALINRVKALEKQLAVEESTDEEHPEVEAERDEERSSPETADPEADQYEMAWLESYAPN